MKSKDFHSDSFIFLNLQFLKNIVTQDTDHGEVSPSTSNSEESTSKNPEARTPATLQFLQEVRQRANTGSWGLYNVQDIQGIGI